MKTIFISIFQGAEAKNILRTDIYRKLLEQKNLKIVLFVKTRERAEYYKKEFVNPRVIYEVADCRSTPFLDKIFSRIKFNLINTETMDLKRRLRLEETGNYVGFILSWFFNKIFSRPIIRRIIRFLDYFLIRGTSAATYFKKYSPDLVFCAHLFDDAEVDFVREAKRRGVHVIGLINSWDKLTARCMIRLLPDKLLVYNEIVKKEAIELADMKEGDIIPVGIPQYDIYFNNHAINREEFFKKIKIDPNKKLIVCAPIGKAFSDSDWGMIDLVHKLIIDGLAKDAELLVRFQPNDFFDENEIKKRPWLKYDLPGIRFSAKRGVDWDMSFADLEHLTNTLQHMSLLICYFSSISIDAAVFDKPVININFEARSKEQHCQSLAYFYHQITHYKKAIATGGIRMVNSENKLVEWINRYLKNPELDSEGRKRLVLEQCWKLDGQSGKRTADLIISNLDLS